MKSRALSIAVATLVLLGILTPGAGAQSASPAGAGIVRGYLPSNPNYWQVKAALDAQPAVAQPGGDNVVATTVPVVSPNFQGESANDAGLGGVSPSDATGAIGPTEYIELVNQVSTNNGAIAVYNRAGTLLSQNSEAGLTGFSAASGDGVINFDTSQSRFYVAMLYISGSDNELIFGFSKGSSPSASGSDWCFYHSKFGDYGVAFPDYPKLGETNDFYLIGVNEFSPSFYTGSDLAWATKPAAGTITTCPALSNFKTGNFENLKNSDGTLAFTPVPADLIDPSGTGYVVASHDVENPGTSASSLSVFTVTKGGAGTPVLSAATNVPVTSYSMPPDAPQKGTSDVLDTLDGRLMTAKASADPLRNNAVAVWTQHTVKASNGGMGSEVRWYEINPTTGALFQNGIAHSTTAYFFVGGLSSDRNGVAGLFGSNMVLDFSVSSSSMFPAVEIVSKVGASPQSAPVLVKASTKADTDFTCTPSGGGPPCRWGDYAGASADPASPSAGTEGTVWGTVMREAKAGGGNPDWTSQNFGATP